MRRGHKLSKQYHEIKEETVYVLSGVLYNYNAQDKEEIIQSGGVFHVFPGQIHRFGAGDTPVEVIEVSTPHLDDVVRLADDYDRPTEEYNEFMSLLIAKTWG